MAFRIDLTEPALVDAEEYVLFICDVQKEPEAAERWFRGLVQAIYSLEDCRSAVQAALAKLVPVIDHVAPCPLKAQPDRARHACRSGAR